MDEFNEIIDFYKSNEIQSKALRFKNQVEDFFKLNPNLFDIHLPIVHTVKSRLKNDNSLLDKLNRKKEDGKIITLENFTKEVTDLVGVRILHLYLEQFPSIHKEIMSQIENEEWEFYENPKAYSWDDEAIALYENLGIKTQKKEQYTSVHYVIRIKNNDSNPIYCEIQVRTLFEEIWGEIDHTINYPHKTDSVACKEQLKNLSNMIMTGRGMVDSIFKSHKEYIDSKASKDKVEETLQENLKKIVYSDTTLADKYFALINEDNYLIKIISNLKVHNWYTSQNPAIELLLEQDLNKLQESKENAEILFVLGRNIYQAACGNAEKAIEFIKNLNNFFIKNSDFVIHHLYSGMFYEVYFDSLNDLRENSKSFFLDDLYSLERNPRLKSSIEFLRNALLPHKNRFFILPNSIPETIDINIFTKTLILEDELGKRDVVELESIKINGYELISDTGIIDIPIFNFNTKELIKTLSHVYTIPKFKIQINDFNNLFIRFPKGIIRKK